MPIEHIPAVHPDMQKKLRAHGISSYFPGAGGRDRHALKSVCTKSRTRPQCSSCERGLLGMSSFECHLGFWHLWPPGLMLREALVLSWTANGLEIVEEKQGYLWVWRLC